MNQERRSQIVEMLNKNGTVSNNEIMETFGISIETVRRDLAFLEKNGQCERVYGGAVKKKFMSVEPEYLNREKKNSSKKQQIAIEAEKLIEVDDTVFFDLGTTVEVLAQMVDASKKITAFTNALRTAITLSDKCKKVIIPGGDLRTGEYSVSGCFAEDYMQKFNVDKAIIGVGGITPDGVTDFIMSEARFRLQLIKNANTVIALADFSKFGVRAVCKVCDVEDVDILITDKKAPIDIIKEIEKKGVKVIIAK